MTTVTVAVTVGTEYAANILIVRGAAKVTPRMGAMGLRIRGYAQHGSAGLDTLTSPQVCSWVRLVCDGDRGGDRQ